MLVLKYCVVLLAQPISSSRKAASAVLLTLVEGIPSIECSSAKKEKEKSLEVNMSSRSSRGRKVQSQPERLKCLVDESRAF